MARKSPGTYHEKYRMAFLLVPAAYAQTSTKCADLTGFKNPGVPMVITKAATVPASSAPRSSTAETSATSATIPSHCQADGMINERTGADGRNYGIGFSLALPDNWNNRFLFQGGGRTLPLYPPPPWNRKRLFQLSGSAREKPMP